MAGIALLGAGIFARSEHLAAIESNPNLKLRAVYSRSQASAQALAAATATSDPSSLSLYYDNPAEPGRSLNDLLARDDIAAVAVVLPILTQPAIVRQAIEAGKHVISEKPIAGDLAAAKELLGWYESFKPANGQKKPIWAVAENFRYIDSLRFAVEEVKKVGGRLCTFRLTKEGFIKQDNKYYLTEWRKVPSFQGGFLLDAGVHFTAALRILLGAVGEELCKIVGFSGLLVEHLVPVDTVNAAALTKSGKSGSIHMTFGTEFKDSLEVEIVTTEGSVLWSPTEVRVISRKEGAPGERVESKKSYTYESAVKGEMAAFAKGIESGVVDGMQIPLEALKDLEVLQALLESGEGGAVVKTLEV